MREGGKGGVRKRQGGRKGKEGGGGGEGKEGRELGEEATY